MSRRWSELQPLLDQELSRLPDKYRVVLVLCDLEGKTRKEVARQLGLAEGTVASRLARARTMLAKRLARHGLALSAGSLAMVLSQNAASACVPTSVVSSTIKAANVFAAGKAAMAGVISADVASIMEGVMKAMLLSKLKIAMAVLVVGLLVAGIGTGAFNHWTQATEQTQVEARDEQPKKAGDKPINRTNKVVIYLPRVIENLGSSEFRADLEAAIKRLASVKVTPNITDKWMAEVEFDPGKVDVGELAKALASVKVPVRVEKEPAATLVLPATITEKQQEKIKEALAKVKGVDARKSCYWQPLKAVLVVLDEKGGARFGQIIAALKDFGIAIQEQEPVQRPKGYSIKLFGGDLAR